MITESS